MIRGSAPMDDSTPMLVKVIGSFLIGWCFVVAGVVSYFVVLSTTCFTFRFDCPVWKTHKAKVFIANIFVPLLAAVGIGIAAQPFLSPLIAALGIDAAISNLIPILLVIGMLQICQLKVLIWAPLEKRFITKRLLAQGVTVEQIQAGNMTGISNPSRSSLAKGIIEDDMGVLWVSEDRLVYWGDGERFSVTRDQFVSLEQRGDALNTTALSGVAHVILHFKTPEGTERRIRLHIEGAWTMGQKRRGMDCLADQVAKWHARSEELQSKSQGPS